MKEIFQFYFHGFTLAISMLGHLGCLAANSYVFYLVYSKLDRSFWDQFLEQLKIALFVVLGIFVLLTLSRFFTAKPGNFFLSLFFRFKLMLDFAFFFTLSINRFLAFEDLKFEFLNTACMISITVSVFFDFWMTFLAEKFVEKNKIIIFQIFVFGGMIVLMAEMIYGLFICLLFLFTKMFLLFSAILLSCLIILGGSVFLVFRKIVYVRL